MKVREALCGLALMLVPMTLLSCAPATARSAGEGDSGSPSATDDGSTTVNDSGNPNSGGNDGSIDPNGSCTDTAPDDQNCSCNMPGATRSCWPASANPADRNTGTCKDGTQTCVNAGEFSTWGPCTGASLPPCGGCTDGQTRPCYDGPAGTEGVGVCHGGMQSCVGGQWQTTCVGEQLPQPHNCADNIDHECDHIPGCLDLFKCATDPACQNNCTQAKVDPGCVCPMNTGDQALCPDGYIGKTPTGAGNMSCLTNADCPMNQTCFFFMCIAAGAPSEECCPCTANDCGNPGCCAETVCANNPMCSGLTCNPLPAMCNGMVNADCDDFPEDCDEPCCKCTMCP